MIRLPFSTIELGPRDIEDFNRRQRRWKLIQEENVQTRHFEKRRETVPSSEKHGYDDIPAGDGYTSRQELSDISDQYSSVPIFGPLINLPKNRAGSRVQVPDSADEGSEQEEESTTRHEHEDEDESGLDAHYENISIPQPSSPYKNDFQYGGFVESPSQQQASQTRHSSPFGMLLIQLIHLRLTLHSSR
jgi:hypothetical protein